ncbi:unnamed protein product [Chrysoparadoxa australica]
MAQLSTGQLMALVSKQVEKFDIQEELEKIGCPEFCSRLVDAGYGQRGAFAVLTDEQMSGHPLHIHCKARKRIIALAQMLQRRIALEHDSHKPSLATMEFGKTTHDGINFCSTRADLKEAFKAQMKREEELAELAAHAPPEHAAAVPKPRNLSLSDTFKRIDEGRSGVVATHDAADHSCCEKHTKQLRKSADEMVRGWVDETMFQVEVQLDTADSFGNGYFSREAARSVTEQAMRMNDLEPHWVAVEGLLDSCADELELSYDRANLMARISDMLTEGLKGRAS